MTGFLIEPKLQEPYLINSDGDRACHFHLSFLYLFRKRASEWEFYGMVYPSKVVFEWMLKKSDEIEVLT